MEREVDPASRRIAEVSQIKIGGKHHQYRTIRNCRTCMSPYRQEIEQQLIAGRSYRVIAEYLEELPETGRPHPNATNIRTHYTSDHMPQAVAEYRAIVEARAKVIGKNIETATENLADYQTVNSIIVQKGLEGLTDGSLNPSVAEVLTAIKNQYTIDQAVSDSVDAEAWKNALMAYMEVAMEFIDEDRQEDFTIAFSKHPIISAALKSMSQPQVISGELG